MRSPRTAEKQAAIAVLGGVEDGGVVEVVGTALIVVETAVENPVIRARRRLQLHGPQALLRDISLSCFRVNRFRNTSATRNNQWLKNHCDTRMKNFRLTMR